MSDDFPQVIRIGTRKSKLALAQAEMVRTKLAEAWPELRLELVPMVTTGDVITDRTLADIGGKGLFAKELDEAMIDNKIDIAVHSVKDIESIINKNLILDSCLIREDNRDAFLSRSGVGFAALPAGAVVGTSSVRRASQLRFLRGDLNVAPLRGNVTTRIEKMKAGEVDATFLALAGLKRLGLVQEVTELCDPEVFLPAVGQGAIGIVRRREDAAIANVLKPLNHQDTLTAVTAERAMLAVLDGSCRTPVAGWARREGGELRLTAALYAPDGSESFHVERLGVPAEAEALGRDAGEELRARGGHLLP